MKSLRMLSVLVAGCLACGILLAQSPASKPAATQPSASSQPAGPAKTPKDAIKNLARSIRDTDKGLFLATISVDDKGREAAAALFDMMATMAVLAKDMEKAYGKDAAAQFNSDSIAPSDEEIDKMEFKEEGETATSKDPKGGKSMQFIKKDSVWRIDLNKDMPPESERAKLVKMSNAMVKAVNDVRGKIGQPGMTQEKISEELGKAMMAVMTKSVGEEATSAPASMPS